KGLELDQEIIREREYTYLLNRLAQDLVVKRCSLPEAVEQLTQAEKGRDPRWLHLLKHHYSTHSDDECLALHLGQHALLHCSGNNRHMMRLAQHFEREFRSCFGNNAGFTWQEEHLAPTFLRLTAGHEKTSVETPPSW
ncbi:MAG TPA: hypothetical protein VGY77_12415, partial [Gemmataceae bacterium]|nr:hypothetical protein [Gemmataceae bacterium]